MGPGVAFRLSNRVLRLVTVYDQDVCGLHVENLACRIAGTMLLPVAVCRRYVDVHRVYTSRIYAM